MPISRLEYLRHIVDETDYLIDERQGLSKEQFLQDETLKRPVGAPKFLHLRNRA